MRRASVHRLVRRTIKIVEAAIVQIRIRPQTAAGRAEHRGERQPVAIDLGDDRVVGGAARAAFVDEVNLRVGDAPLERFNHRALRGRQTRLHGGGVIAGESRRKELATHENQAH
jgi:hypothetical protein